MKGIIDFLVNENWQLYGTFLILNLIYVILNTSHTILVMKAKNKWVGAAAGAICYGFYTIVLKAIMGCDTFTTVSATMISNILGGYISWKIAPMIMGRPCQSYKITLGADTIANKQFKEILKENLIPYNYCDAFGDYIHYLKYSIYPKTKEQDKIIEYAIKVLSIKNYHKEEY